MSATEPARAAGAHDQGAENRDHDHGGPEGIVSGGGEGKREPAVESEIGDQPDERDERFGRERLPFKADVRKLKALGLTESLEVGYRLSPRGRAYPDGS